MIGVLLSSVAFACAPIDVTQVMNDVSDALDAGNPEVGLARMTTAWQGLPDACGPVSAGDLALLAQRAGALAWDMGEAELSDRWYDTACTVAPGIPVPAALGPTAAERAHTACTRVATRPLGEAVVESEVVIDGALLPRGTRAPFVAGTHLVVWQDHGLWRGRWQVIPDELPIGMPSGRNRPPLPKLGLPATVFGAGAVLALAGGVAYELGFVQQWNTNCNGLGIDFYEDGWQKCQAEHDVSLSPGFYGGLGLMIGGAAVGVTGVGLGVSAFVDRPGLSVTVPF